MEATYAEITPSGPRPIVKRPVDFAHVSIINLYP